MPATPPACSSRWDPREEESTGEVDGAIERLEVNKDARRVLCPQKDLNFIPAA